MPGAVANTSAHALNHATLPFTLALANLGYQEALRRDEHLLQGMNVHRGAITNKPVADALGLSYVDPSSVLAAHAA